MSRLTEFRKDLNRYEYKQDERGYCFIQEGQIVQKLGKLEDLEEELGCPLDVYTKFVYGTPIYDKNGYKGFINTVKKYEVSGYGKRYIIYVIYFSEEDGRKDVVRGFPLENYKKTFWLKEDKSE